MLEHYQRSASRKQLHVLCVKTLMFLLLWVTPALSNDINGDLNTNYQDSTVDSNNDSVTNNYNAAGAASSAPVMSAIAPTVMGSGGNDSCLISKSTGVQVTMFGISRGSMQQDDNCNRRKNARLLGAPQTVGAIALITGAELAAPAAL